MPADRAERTDRIDHLSDLTFTDLVAGYVVAHDPVRGVTDLRTSDGRAIRFTCSPTVSVEFLRNLGQPRRQAGPDLDRLLTAGRYVLAHGIFTPTDIGHGFEVHRLILPTEDSGAYITEDGGWWTRQLLELSRFYRRAQFGDEPVDFGGYRTQLRLSGHKQDHFVQETDTISRLVYGMASAYMLSGDESFLEVAEKGTEYLRDHMRFVDRDEDVVYWYHGIDVRDGRTTKLFSSEFDDDHRTVPAYEQIYALTGPTQTYRITGDPRILADVEGTLRLFGRFFHDDVRGGWYSHVDPLRLSPHDESLGPNRSRKNWNSIGDHAPAYLFNLLLATGDRRHLAMLEESFNLILRHFDRPDSALVQERFHGDWEPDLTWGWQQDRGVVGHNLKIAWNLTRMNAVRPRRGYRELAERIGRTMPAVGGDQRRGGWYDVVDRVLADGARSHRLSWHDRKAWWQQEQAILAYLVLAGGTGDEFFRRQARESAAFYNAYFLDHDDGGVYFSVLADGTPFLVGTERFKGSHSMSMYHAAELCLLAGSYQRLLLRDEPLELWFRPRPDGFENRVLRVAPDVFPTGRVRLEAVEVEGSPYRDFDPEAMAVRLPDSEKNLTVRVRLVPTGHPEQPAERSEDLR